MKKNLIISRYEEDIRWIFDHNYIADKIHIYNKGSHLEIDKSIFYKELDNYGRECSTYLTFIIDFYEQLNSDDIYIFSQANPFDHNTLFIDSVVSLTEDTILPETLSTAYGIEKTSAHMGDIKDTAFPRGIPLRSYFNHLFLGGLSGEHTVKYHALWAVKGSALLFRSKSFYEYCLGLIPETDNSIEAHIFERLWQYIFDGKTLDWITHYKQYRSQFIGGNWNSHLIS